MYYTFAGIAIIGVAGYQYFVKRVPTTINPFVSIVGRLNKVHVERLQDVTKFL